MIILIDADTLAFAAAASCEDKPDPFLACARVDSGIENILKACDPDNPEPQYELWLTGKDNFRYKVYPEYKGNRKESYRPRWEKDVKDYLITAWEAQWSEGCEADDMVGVRQMELENSIICHIDKDIDMIPGKHYGWPIIREGKTVREEQFYTITPEEALRKFYRQLLTGDVTDNIKGATGIGPVKADRILANCETEEEMFHACLDHYGSMEEMTMNARCLWIWRERDDDVTKRWTSWLNELE